MANRADARTAASQAVSRAADEMCRRSVEIRKEVAVATNRDFVQPCPACPYTDCVIGPDGKVSRSKPEGERH